MKLELIKGAIAAKHWQVQLHGTELYCRMLPLILFQDVLSFKVLQYQATILLA